jgi:hemolysin activation/secretion protein
MVSVMQSATLKARSMTEFAEAQPTPTVAELALASFQQSQGTGDERLKRYGRGIRAHFYRRWAAWILLGLTGLAAGVGPAGAQTASQITPGTFAPPIAGGVRGGIDIGVAPSLDTPAGAETLFVTLQGVTIEGGFPALSAKEGDVRARLAGRRLSGADIFAAARELEAAYAKAGYVLVRVTLPKQKLVDGATLRFQVIDGFIERIEVKSLPPRIRNRIASILAPLTGMHALTLSELERRILLAGDVPGVVLRSTLAPGSTLGATVLVIEAHDQPLNAVFNADNTLSAQLGGWQIGAGFDLNSVLGLGELFYFRATGDPNGGDNGFTAHYPRNRILAAGVIVPLGDDGVTFNAEGTLALTTPDANGGLQSTDNFQRLSLRLRYPWLRSRDANLSSQLAFDVEDEKESTLLASVATPLALDRLRVLRLVNEADYIVPTVQGGPFAHLIGGGTLSGSLTPSVGLDVLGARTAGDATPTLPLSVQGANATFVKLDGTLSYTQAFAEHLAAALNFHGQTSFGSSLVHSEQIGVVGSDQLSAFDVGTLQGDSGYAARGELQFPFALSQIAVFSNLGPLLARLNPGGVGIVVSPYGFADGGEVVLHRPTALEHDHISAASFGAGLRIGGAGGGTLSNGQIALEYGRETRSDGVPDGDRFTLVSWLRF